jgi:hypothetical protein
MIFRSTDRNLRSEEFGAEAFLARCLQDGVAGAISESDDMNSLYFYYFSWSKARNV